MKKEEPILVAIHCLVYNHEPYLRDCFEGFVMQKTNFRFVAIVHDDVSTDNSAAIIREYAEKYPDIIKPIFETENQWSKHDGSLDRIMSDAIAATGAKYIAMCEGDDYWTDPNKLQKQVDFLEEHPEYGCCCHRFVLYFENSKQFSKSDHWTSVITDNMPGIELNKENSFQIGLLPQILTTIYRQSTFDKSLYRNINPRSQYDQTLFYALIQEAPIWVMNEQMGVYRRHEGGTYTSIKGTLKAVEKMYITWHDAYEVYHSDETKSMYMGSLSVYISQYIKRAAPIERKELKRLIAEYKSINGGHILIKIKWKIIKAFLYRILKRKLLK